MPLNAPNQMKCQKVTWPVKMISPSARVARQFRPWEAAMTRFFGKRSASTPPHSEKTTMGSMNDRVTQARSSAEEVSV